MRPVFGFIPPGSCDTVQDLGSHIQSFLKGKPVSFALDQLAMDTCSDFQRKVLLAEHNIPRGMVSTYGRIARHIGRTGAARAVGTALARNPFPIVIPCHRAVRSDGTLGGYQGGLSMKRALLEVEGVLISSDGKIIDPKFFY
jgi:methylated-DNA-[protein]-cysteine S-methyltransferase